MAGALPVILAVIAALAVLAGAFFLMRPKCNPPGKRKKDFFSCDCSADNTELVDKVCTCVTGTFLKNGVCVPCGKLGADCCAGDPQCDELSPGIPAACSKDGKCVSCGYNQGDPCCPGSTKCMGYDLECDAKTGTCLKCGGTGYPCCTQRATKCDNSSDICKNGSCTQCSGDPGTDCCPGVGAQCPGSGEPSECVGGTCVACGNPNEVCCTTLQPDCEDETTACQDKKCVPCGLEAGQPCCSGNSCRGYALECENNTCTKCGETGDPCCKQGSTKCYNDTDVCRNDHCTQCSGDPGSFCCSGNFPCPGSGYPAECINDACVPCGRENEACCQTLQPACPDGTTCDNNKKCTRK